MDTSKNSKELLFPQLLDPRHRHHLPPTPTPSLHHPHSRAYSSIHNHGSPQRSSIDTPLSLYASTRARLRLEMDMYVSEPTPRRRRNTIQVPLSALSSSRAVPGAIGGPFNSTTKVKSLPLPTIYNRHQFSSRGIRNVGLHTDRYLPVKDKHRRRTVSDSLLNLSKLQSRQKEHLLFCENGINQSRDLQKEREVIPHRVEQAFYMSGQPAELFSREEIPQAELEELQKIALSQNTHLFYGKGIRSSGGKASKTVQQFEKRLHETVSAQSKSYGLEDIDAGRYSRASRAITPGSPIIEEREDDMDEQTTRKLSSNRTFMTEQNK